MKSLHITKFNVKNQNNSAEGYSIGKILVDGKESEWGQTGRWREEGLQLEKSFLFKLGGQSRAVTAGGQFSGNTDITHTGNYSTACAFQKQKHQFFTRENSPLQKWIPASLQEKTFFVCPIYVTNNSEDQKNKSIRSNRPFATLLPWPHHKPANTTGSSQQGSSRIQFLKLFLWIIAPKWTLTGMQAGLSQSACCFASNGSQPEAILG